MLNRCLYLFILKCYIFLKSLLNFFTILLLFCVWLSGQEACGILAPLPGIETTPPALEDEVLTIEQPGKLQVSVPYKSYT